MTTSPSYGRARARRAASAAVPLLLALAIPASAFGQATRTWVSGVGDDANPCSRTAPCKTWAGAISKTAAGGEIDALDPGGFGGLTITKSITINGNNVTAGVLVSGTAGFTIAAGASDNVVLTGLDINGLGFPPSWTGVGLDGVRVLSAGNVRIDNSLIYGFQNGVQIEPSSGVTKVAIMDDKIYNNEFDGVLDDPGSGAKGKATLVDDQLTNNNCGVVTASYGGGGTVTGAGTTNCGVNSGTGGSGIATMTTFGSSIADNTATAGSTGIFAEGATASNRIGDDNVLGNTTGLLTGDGGAITSFGNNSVIGNNTNGTPTPPNATQSSRRHTKKHGSKKHSAIKR